MYITEIQLYHCEFISTWKEDHHHFLNINNGVVRQKEWFVREQVCTENLQYGNSQKVLCVPGMNNWLFPKTRFNILVTEKKNENIR